MIYFYGTPKLEESNPVHINGEISPQNLIGDASATDLIERHSFRQFQSSRASAYVFRTDKFESVKSR